jgi:hypothetical protein
MNSTKYNTFTLQQEIQGKETEKNPELVMYYSSLLLMSISIDHHENVFGTVIMVHTH